MKIAHICPFVGERMGGSERYVSNISRMQSQKHEVHVFTTTSQLNRTGTSCEQGIFYHRFYCPAIIWNINPISVMLKQLVEADMDVFHVHSHLYTTSNQAILAKLLRKKKVLLQIHGGIGLPPYKTTSVRRWTKQIYDKSIAKFTLENSDLITSVSKSDLDKISSTYRISREKLRYVPNTVNVVKFPFSSSINGSRKTILFVGDLERWKGVESLIQWISDTSYWDDQSFTIRFVGQGTLYPLLLRLKDRFQVNGHPIKIEVLGQMKHSEIPRILRAANALVLPSFWEGMPTVVLEAMASGTPVLSTRVGDVPFVIQNNHNGLLFESSVSSFRDAVFSILTDDTLANKIARNARLTVEQEFSLERVTDRLLNLYSSLAVGLP